MILAALDAERNLLSSSQLQEFAVKFNETFERFAVKLNELVAAPQAGSFSRAGRVNPRHDQRKAAGFYPYAQPVPVHDFGPINFRQGLGNAPHRNGESDSLALSDRHVDANQFATQIDQRAAAVSRIDGRIGLEPILNVQRLYVGG